MAKAPMRASGQVVVAGPPLAVWTALLDPAVLQSLIPGAETVQRLTEDRYHALLSYGVGRLRGRYSADLHLTEALEGSRLRLSGVSTGPFGGGSADATVTFAAVEAGTTITWAYDGHVTGLYAFVPAAMLRAAAERFVGRFFTALGKG